MQHQPKINAEKNVSSRHITPQFKHFQPLFLLGFFVVFSPATQAQVCSINGHSVQVDCFTYDGCGAQTGEMVCANSDGTPFGEWEIHQGNHSGYEKQFDYKGGYIEQTVDEKREPQGTSKQFSSSGALLAETDYEHGRKNGKAHAYYPSSHVKSAEWWEQGVRKFSASYLDNGKLAGLQCSDHHVMDEDISLCGFDGKPSLVNITLPQNETRTVSYLNGVLLNKTFASKGNVITQEEYNQDDSSLKEYFPDGTLRHEAYRKQGRLDGMETEYHSSGQIIRKTLWENGEMRKEELYFLNGQMKLSAERQKQGDRWVIAVKDFDDNGRLHADGTYIEEPYDAPAFGLSISRWRYTRPIGEFHEYDPAGPLISTSYYDENHKLKEKKYWDSSGNLLHDDDIFEDGSRKSRIGTEKQ